MNELFVQMVFNRVGEFHHCQPICLFTVLFEVDGDCRFPLTLVQDFKCYENSISTTNFLPLRRYHHLPKVNRLIKE